METTLKRFLSLVLAFTMVLSYVPVQTFADSGNIEPCAEHNYSVTIVTNPTCTEGGYTTHTCSVCGTSYTDGATEALGHSYASVVTDPTCTDGGYTTNTCSACGDAYVSDEVAALGHNFADGICSVCGVADPDYKDPTETTCEHNYQTVITDPTCTAAGSKVTTCSKCGDSSSEEIAATGHKFVDGTCVCGETEEVEEEPEEDEQVKAVQAMIDALPALSGTITQKALDAFQTQANAITAELSKLTEAQIAQLTGLEKLNPAVTVEEEADPVAKIGDQGYATLQEALNAAAAGSGEITVEILNNIDLTDVDWNPVTVSEPHYPEITVEGNDKTITGLNDMLFAGTWAGSSSLIIKNLTIEDSNIVNDEDDTKGDVGVGAFIGFPEASATITLENCHLVNSTVKGGHWTGGLIGYAAGYAGNDGPVFMNLNIKDCSVTESTITGEGSVGGVIGHGSGNGWTKVTIEDTVVSGNTITSTGSSTNKAGAVMGTIGAAGQATTVNGVEKTGGAFVDAVVSDNAVTSNGTAITTIYGRQGTETGTLEITGGSYDANPIEKDVSYAYPAEGYVIDKNADGTYGLGKMPAVVPVAKIGDTPYASIEAALAAASAGDTITLVQNLSDVEIVADKNLTITGNVTLTNVSINANGADELTVSGLTFTGNSWINSGTAEKLTVSGVTANVTPSNATYTNSRSAFISLGRNEGQQLALTVENCNIVAPSGTDAILGWAAITEATLTGNTFGSASVYQENGDSVKFMAIADGAVFNITGNTVYSNYNGIVLAQNTTRGNAYTANFEGNTFIGGADHIWIEISGGDTCHATVNAASSNTVNGNTLTAGDIKAHTGVIKNWSSYVGVDVVTDEDGKVIGGNLAFYNEEAIADGYAVDENGAVKQEVVKVAKVGDVEYTDLLEAIKAAAPAGTVELLSDVTVDKWVMISEILTIGDGTVITLDMNGLTIDGNDHTLAIKEVESANNGNHIFYDGDYNVCDLTIVMGENVNGLGITSGTISNVTFIGGHGVSGGAAIFVSDGVITGVHAGNVTIEGCTFKNNGGAICYETAQNGLVVNNNTFEVPAEANVILLRGTEKFTNNTVLSGRTVNVVSGSPVVSGNNFGNVRLKVYNEATATISKNTINNLEFNKPTEEAKATFSDDNTLSENAQAALEAVTPKVAYIGTVGYKTLGEALQAAAATEDLTVITLAAGEHELGSVKFPATMKNVTIQGAENKATIIKNSKLYSADGNSAVYEGIIFDGIVFDNSSIAFTGNRNGEVVYKNWTITNCEFKDVVTTANYSAVHFNLAADEAIENFTFTNNAINGVSGGNASGLRLNYATGEITITGNDISNVAWNAIQMVNTNADKIIIQNNKLASNAYEGILNLNNVTAETLTIQQNKFLVKDNQPGVCYITNVDVSGNYWGGEEPANLPNGVTYKSYYADAEMKNLVELLSGNGTESDPYLINSLEDLQLFRDKVNSGKTFDNEYVKLTADIDLASQAWTPIGNATNKFLGTFDGDNHTISNLVVNADTNNVGLFGFASVIKNVEIHNAKVAGVICVGALAGELESSVGTVENCHVTGTIQITGENSVGGLVGKGYANIRKSSVTGDDTSFVEGVYGNTEEGDNIGGLIGHLGEGNTLGVSNSTVMDITVKGTRKVGGLVGTTARGNDYVGNKVVNVIVECTATADYANANASTTTIGGIIGNYFGSATSGGILKDSTVQNVTFILGNGKSAGALAGGDRNNNGGAPVGVEATSNTLSDIVGATNEYLVPWDGVTIKNLDQLKKFRDAVNEGDTYAGKTVTLMTDIDLASVENWVPIGTFEHSFDGNFNGNGHKIMNLKISDNTAATDEAYLGFFGVTANNTIENFTIENVTINSNGQIVAAAIAYPYYTTVKDITVSGDIAIKGGDYTSGVLGYTRICENASNLVVSGNTDSYITGANVVGGVIADIQMNHGLAANYSNFKAENVTITGNKCVGGISGIIASQTLNGATVKNVALVCSDARVGVVAGSLGGTSTISNVTTENVTGATAIIGGAYDGGKPVQAKIGNTYYTTFDAALADAEAGDNIILFTTIEIPQGETKVIDLKGVTVTMVTSDDAVTSMIYNKGNLTIEDSVGNGKLSYQYTGTKNNDAFNTIESAPGSVLTIKGGEIENLSENCLIAYAVDGLTNGGAGDVTVNIEGGKISSKKIAVRIFANSTSNTGNLNIAGGEINGRVIIQNASAKANKAELKITGGTFTSNGYKTDVLYVGGTEGATGDITASVTGGIFNGEILNTTSDKRFISGGTFSEPVSEEYCEEGYIPTKNSDDTYGVKAGSYAVRNFTTDVGYETLAEAVAAANDDDTITVLSDMALTEGVTVAGKSITLDLNGKTISGTCNASQATLIYIDNGAKLTVEDSAGNGKITYAQGTSKVGWTVDVKGDLVLESGTIELTGSWDIGYAVDVRPNSWGTEYTEATTFVMNGGNIVSSDGGVRVASSSAAGHKKVSASFVMNGGTIDAAWDGVFIQQSDAAYDVLSFTMNGGTIESDLNPVRIYGPVPTGYVNDQDCMTINLLGGTMDYTGNDETLVWVIEDILRVGGGSSAQTIVENGALKVSGEIALNAAVPEDFEWVANNDGTYSLKAKVYAAKIGNVKFETLEEALSAAQDGDTITLLSDIESADKINIEKNITINGNEKKLTYTGSDRAIEMATDASKQLNVTIKNLTVDCTSSYCQRGINYNDDGELKLENVTVQGENVTYALNLPGNSDNCTVKITGSKFSANTALNIWGEYSTITALNSEFVSVDKTEVENYTAIALNNDGKTAANNTRLTITGGKITALDEKKDPSTAVRNSTLNTSVVISANTDVIGAITNPVAIIDYGADQFYSVTNIQDAIDKVIKDGKGKVKLVADVAVETTITVNGTVTLDLNGHTIAGKDTSDKSFSLIRNTGTFTITDSSSANTGTITLEATVDSGWKRYSSVISNTVGGKLIVEDGTIAHLGGTDMAYAIDNLTNGKGTRAETIINGGTIKSTYTAIRQFLNGVEAQNIVTVNGGTIQATKRAIYFQDPSANANSGKLTVGKNAAIWDEIYLEVCAGSTEWPVEVKVAKAALKDAADAKIVTENIPVGYEVLSVLDEGVEYFVVRGIVARDSEGNGYATLQDALNAGGVITLLKDIDLKEGCVTVAADKNVTLNLAGHNITGTPAKAAAYAVITNNGTLTINGEGTILCDHTLAGSTAYAVNTITNSGTLTINGATIENKSTASNQIGYAIDNNSTSVNAIATIESGKVIASGSNYYDGIRQFCNSLTAENTVTVKGGEVSSIWLQNPSDNAQVKNTKDVKGNFTITGGKVDVLSLEPSTSFNGSISGGHVGEVAYFQTAENRDLTGFITGGTFDKEPAAAMIAVGYKCEQNTDNSTYIVKQMPVVAVIGETPYYSLPEAIEAAANGDTIQLMPGTITETVAPWAKDSQHTTEKSITIIGADDFGTKLTGGLYLGYDDSGCRAHTITIKGIHFEGKGVLVAGQQNVVIEGNKFTNITDVVATDKSATANAISVIGKNVIATVTNNIIETTASGGIHLRDVKDATVTGNTVANVKDNTITINPTTGSNGTIIVENNTLSSWGLGGEGRAMRISGGETVTVNGNVMTNANAPEEFVKVDPAAANMDASQNYWGGQNPTAENIWWRSETDTDAGVVEVLKNYYTDAEKTNLVDLRPDVARIGETGYKTLQAALDAAKEGDEIVMLVPHTVAAGETLTLSKPVKITYTSDVMGQAMFTNKGELIVDGAEIIYTYTGAADSAYGKGNYTIANSGTLTVKSGLVENATAKMSHASYAIDNYSGATLNVNGGVVLNETNYAIRQATFGTGDNIVNVTGGEIIGTRAVWIQLPGSDTNVAPVVKLNVNGGILESTGESRDYEMAVYSYSYGNSMENVAINISGGSIYGDIALTGGANKTKIETVKITGGTFKGYDGDLYSYGDDTAAEMAIEITGGTFSSNDAEIYATTEGYEFVRSGRVYEVTKIQNVAKIGTTEYRTLQEAVDEAAEDAVITLIGTPQDYFVKVNKKLTIQTSDKYTYDHELIFPGADLEKVVEETYIIKIKAKTTTSVDEGPAVAYVDLNEDGSYDSATETKQTLKAALTAAKNGDKKIVRLTDNLTIEDSVTIPAGVTLDIQSYTLDVDALIGLKDSKLGGAVDGQKNSTLDAGGILKVAKDSLKLSTDAFTNGTQVIVPIWDPNSSAGFYRFTQVVVNTTATSSAPGRGLEVNKTEDYMRFQFKNQATSDPYNILMKNYGGTDLAFDVIARIEWQRKLSTGETVTEYHTFVYSDEMIQTAAGNADYYFKLTGYSKLEIDMDTLAVFAMFVTDSGVTVSGDRWNANGIIK